MGEDPVLLFCSNKALRGSAAVSTRPAVPPFVADVCGSSRDSSMLRLIEPSFATHGRLVEEAGCGAQAMGIIIDEPKYPVIDAAPSMSKTGAWPTRARPAPQDGGFGG